MTREIVKLLNFCDDEDDTKYARVACDSCELSSIDDAMKVLGFRRTLSSAEELELVLADLSNPDVIQSLTDAQLDDIEARAAEFMTIVTNERLARFP